MPEPSVRLPEWARQLLRCPACHSVLTDAPNDHGGSELHCTASECAKVFLVDELGIPDLVLDD